jgi:hypothetical protein
MTNPMTDTNKALEWLDQQERAHFGEVALLKGFAFDGSKYETPEHFKTIRAALSPDAVVIPREKFERVRHALELISKRPNLPNPDRDADWKNCQKNSSFEAKEALAILSQYGEQK